MRALERKTRGWPSLRAENVRHKDLESTGVKECSHGVVNVFNDRFNEVFSTPQLADAIERGEDLELVEQSVARKVNKRRGSGKRKSRKEAHLTPSTDLVSVPRISKYPEASVFSILCFERTISEAGGPPSCADEEQMPISKS